MSSPGMPTTYAAWLEQNLGVEEARDIYDYASAREFVDALPDETFYVLMNRYRNEIEVELYGGWSLDGFLAERGDMPQSIDDVFAILLAVQTERLVNDGLIYRIEKRVLDGVAHAAHSQPDSKRL